MRSFYERRKRHTESYTQFYTNLNNLAEKCSLHNKVSSIKLKLFMEASMESFFYNKLADMKYDTLGIEELLFILQIYEKDEGNSSSIEIINNSGIENPETHIMSSHGGNSVTILNKFLNTSDAAVPFVDSGNGNKAMLPIMGRETCSEEQSEKRKKYVHNGYDKNRYKYQNCYHCVLRGHIATNCAYYYLKYLKNVLVNNKI